MPFSFSLNKRAAEMFLHGEDAVGLRVELTEYGCRMKPVKSLSGMHVIPINERVRGNYASSQIEGSTSEGLMRALTHPLGYHFFILNRGPGGWIEVRPWDGPDEKQRSKGSKAEPYRFVPHLRVWQHEKSKKDDAAEVVNFQESTSDDQPAGAATAKDLLLQIVEAASGIDKLTLGRALGQVRKIAMLCDIAEEPLESEARREAAILMRAGSRKARNEEQAAGAAPSPEAPAQTPVPSPEKVSVLVAPRGPVTARETRRPRAAGRSYRGIRPNDHAGEQTAMRV